MMGEDSKENSSPVDKSENVSGDELVAPAKRMKLDSDAKNGSTSSPEKEHSSSGEPSETAHSSLTDQHNDTHNDPDVITLSDTEPPGENANGSTATTPSRVSSAKKLKLTPAEKEKRRKERLREMEERRIKHEELQAAKELKKKERAEQAHKRRIEKENLAREREEQKKIASEKKKAEEELKKQKEKEREEQRRRAHEKKQAEEELKKMREKEREQRRREEEEKKEQRRKEEEEKRDKKKKELESEELRKKRASDHFMSFFNKVEKQLVNYGVETEGPALPFEVKEGMVLAPIQRRRPLSPNSYTNILTNPIEKAYLSNLPRRTDAKRSDMRSKLFQFHDNYRPPYYGTWRRRSKCIRGRRPFAKDTEILDYNVDSDEEWEEEPEGEECDDDNNRSDESECSDEENDGFLVEHGYLSDGEGSGNEEDPDVHEDDAERLNRLHALAEDWKNSIKERTKPRKLVPKLYGPVFGETNAQTPAHLQPIFFFNYD